MSTLVVPGFVHEVRAYGRFDVDGCLNCGSCTVVCSLSDGRASFPRKPMQQTLLGLKSSLVGSLEPWLCHDCGDCATACPRQTEPRESMMTLRRYLAAHYDLTGISSRIHRSRTWELKAMGVVALLVFVLVVLYHLYYVDLIMDDFVSTPMGLEHMFPLMTYFSLVVFLLPLSIMVANAVRMYRYTMTGNSEARIPFHLYLTEAKTLIIHLFTHRNLRQCSEDAHHTRWIGHLLLGTACTMMCVIPLLFLGWFQTDAIYPFYHPQRLLGYCAAAVMIVVPLDIVIRRIRKRDQQHKFSEPSDLIFPIMLLLVAVTGIAVHIFRYAEMSLACHYTYALHLAVVVSLVMVEMPFGKWSHVMYRPLALYFESVKERAASGAAAHAEATCAGEPVLKGTQPT
jgi:ferredoxin